MSNDLQNREQTYTEKLQKFLESDKISKLLISSIGDVNEYNKVVADTLMYISNQPSLQKISVDNLSKLCLQSYQLGVPLNSEKLSYVMPLDGDYVLVPTAKGLIKNTIKTNPNIVDIRAFVIYPEDFFECGDKSDGGCYYDHKINYKSADYGDLKKIIGCYALIQYKNNISVGEFVPKADLEAIKNKSKMKQNGPWIEFTQEMFKKSSIKRLLKNRIGGEINTLIDYDNETFFDLKEKEPKVVNNIDSSVFGIKKQEKENNIKEPI